RRRCRTPPPARRRPPRWASARPGSPRASPRLRRSLRDGSAPRRFPRGPRDRRWRPGGRHNRASTRGAGRRAPSAGVRPLGRSPTRSWARGRSRVGAFPSFPLPPYASLVGGEDAVRGDRSFSDALADQEDLVAHAALDGTGFPAEEVVVGPVAHFRRFTGEDGGLVAAVSDREAHGGPLGIQRASREALENPWRNKA